MSKSSLDMVTTRKGGAFPASLDPVKETPKEESKEEPKEATKEPSLQPRRRPWDGQEEWKKTNYEMPLRVQTKLKEMKNWGYIPNVYKFVAEAVEKEIDKVIAKAEKEGY